MKALVKAALRQLGYEVQGTRLTPRQLLDSANLRAVEFEDIVCRRLYGLQRPFNFVQVGAFDGITRDPLRGFIQAGGWRGVLIEPQPTAAERLRALYADASDIGVVQAAVADQDGSRTLYTIAEGAAPAWAGGLASFDRANILKHAHLIPGLEAMVREETVPCVTFGSVLAFLDQDPLDLLQVDTEGADAQILACFPFDQVRPAIVHWEIKHLTKVQREETFERLLGLGYRLARSGGEDMMAVGF